MTKFKVDFSSIDDSSSNSVAVGRHVARIEAITKEDGSKAPYLKWELKIVKGVSKGLHINHITSLSPSALFNLRDTLEALGVKVPKAAVSIDPDKFIGKEIGIEVVMKPYDGKDYPNVKKVFRADEERLPSVVETDSDEDLSFDSTSSDDEVSIDLD